MVTLEFGLPLLLVELADIVNVVVQDSLQRLCVLYKVHQHQDSSLSTVAIGLQEPQDKAANRLS